MSKFKYFRDPIHGFIHVKKESVELEIISHPLFQRLRRIKQLGLTDYVYHGADHTRFAHSLGVMHVARRIIEKIETHLDEIKDYKEKILLAALLHDIGHPPLSHSFELALQGFSHEDYTCRIIEDTEIKDILLNNGFSEKEIKEIVALIKGQHKFPIGNQIINSELDADRLDYLLRDSLYCGVKYGVYDLERLLISLEVSEDKGLIAVSHRGLDAVDGFIMARFSMYKQVYTHKTKRAFEILLQEILNELKDLGLLDYPDLKDDLDENLVDKDDIWLFSKLRELCRSGTLKNDSRSERLRNMIKMLLHREPLRMPKRYGEHEEYVEEERQQFTPRYHFLAHLKDYTQVQQDLENEGIPIDDVFIDTPSLKIKESPYYTPRGEEVEERGIWILDRNGSLKEITETRRSLVMDFPKRRLYIVRIYTIPQYRAKLDEVLAKHLQHM